MRHYYIFLDLRKKDTIINCKGLCTVECIPIAEVCKCDKMHNNEIGYFSLALPLTSVWRCQTIGNWPLTLLTDKSRSESTPISPENTVRLESPLIPRNYSSHSAALSSILIYTCLSLLVLECKLSLSFPIWNKILYLLNAAHHISSPMSNNPYSFLLVQDFYVQSRSGSQVYKPAIFMKGTHLGSHYTD